MNIKKRKIFKRVGAALMLGLSLFGLGTRASKGQTRVMPRKVKHIRKEEQENISAENQQLLTSVEEEAKKAIQEEQNQQQKEEKDNYSVITRSQTALRYTALAVWVIGFGLFFTSLTFNAPFSLGKKVMSALPGNPHLASIFLTAEKDLENRQLIVTLLADSNSSPVDLIKTSLAFSSDDIYLKKYEINEEKIKEAILQSSEGQMNEKVNLDFIFKVDGSNFDKKEVARLYFSLRKMGGNINIKIDEEGSLILYKKEGEEAKNILGKTENLQISLD